MNAVGIDFGTTNCVVSTFGSGAPEPLVVDEPPGNWAGLGFDRVLPSVFAVDGAGHPKFGWAAKQLREARRVDAVKRLLATEESLALGDEVVIVDEIVALLFAHLRLQARDVAAVDFDRAVVTVPANSKGPARMRTKTCAQLAGIDVMALINEPTAAAMAYGLRAVDEMNILVFDFGGGTLDVTLLKASEGVFQEMASKGIAKLGGVDFDHELLKRVLETVPDHRSWSEADMTSARLAIELAKIKLSKGEETNIELPNGEYRRFTRRRFEEIAKPLIERTRDPIERCLSDTGLSSASIDSLVLVGGTSKIPAVREFVMDIVGMEPVSGVDAMTAVGEGAAIAAAILEGRLETNDFLVGIEHALGTVVADPSTHRLEFSQIIPRNQKIPARGSETYRPVNDFQDSVHVVVMEGDPEKPMGHPDNATVWEGVVAIPEPRPMAEITLEFTYEYDVDGITWVTLRDVERNITIQPLDRMPITRGVSKDKRALVDLAGRVGKTMDEQAMRMPAPTSGETKPVDELVVKARTKVIPFLDDEQAASLRMLVEALESAEDGNEAAARDALATELRKYSYLM